MLWPSCANDITIKRVLQLLAADNKPVMEELVFGTGSL